MKYFLRVFCQTNNHIAPEEVVAFVREGVFFDKKPEIQLKKKDDLNWEIRTVYDQKKDPVIIYTSVADAASKKEIEEIKFVLNISKKSKAKESVEKLVKETVLVYVMEINQAEITDDCWEMLDSIEAYLLRTCNGILFTSDNEFFDQNLKMIYKL